MLFHEMSREQLASIASDALVVVPIGATEQHGPHLPAGTDFLIVERIARRAADVAEAEMPVVVTPTLPFGSSHHHLPFGATMSLSTEVYYRVLMDLGASLVTDGFRRIFFLNGHGGNHELAQVVARDLALQQPVNAAATSYWVVAWQALAEAGAGELGRYPGHASAFETSLILASRPELVDTSRTPHRDEPGVAPLASEAAYRAEYNGYWQSIDGFTGSPDLADPELGRRFFDVIVQATARAFVEFGRVTLRARQI
ncbi:MAG: creatininase family protein [Chloroflexi bacterium]|nr:creatininase family protein [Chloroflexota bacterium]